MFLCLLIFSSTQLNNLVANSRETPHTTITPSNATLTDNKASVDAVIIPPAAEAVVITADTLPITPNVFLIFYTFLEYHLFFLFRFRAMY